MLAVARRWAVLVLGVALLVVGAAVINQPMASFGWFAYAPLSATTFVPVVSYMPQGLFLVALGLVLVSGWVGYQLGKRRTAR